MIRKLFLLFPLCGSIFAQVPGPVSAIPNIPINGIPLVSSYSQGIPVLSLSKLIDNGTTLLYNGSPIGGVAGVSGINSVAGAFTFTGSGVNCSGTTCTFSGGSGGGVSGINSVAGAFTFTGPGVSCSGTTCTFSGGSGSGTVNSGSSYSIAYYPTGGGAVVSGATPFTGIGYFSAVGPPVVATAANIVSTFSGTPSSSTYLGGDGANHAAIVPGGSNGYIQYNNSGVLGGKPLVGTGTSIPTVPATAIVSGHGVVADASGGMADSGAPPVAVGTSAQIPVVNSGATGYAPVTVSGDCTLTSTGAITCATLGGSSPFNAANISSGTLPAARLQGGTNCNTSDSFYLSPFTGNCIAVTSSASVTGIRKSAGAGSTDTAAVAGTDYVVPSGSITGTAANLSGTPTVPNGTSATTQTAGDTTIKLATDAFATAAATAVASSTVTGPRQGNGAGTADTAATSPQLVTALNNTPSSTLAAGLIPAPTAIGAVPLILGKTAFNVATLGDSWWIGYPSSSGYPSAPSSFSIPVQLMTLPIMANGTLKPYAVGGYNLAQTTTMYTTPPGGGTSLHTLSPSISGTPGFLLYNCLGNDYANIGTTYSNLAAYETATANLWSTIAGDGWKIIVPLQVPQGSGRAAYDNYRLQFNEWLKTQTVANGGSVSYVINSNDIMNTISNSVSYEQTLQEHSTALSSLQIANEIAAAIIAGGTTPDWGKKSVESAKDLYNVVIDNSTGGNIMTVRNTSAAGYSILDFLDSTGADTLNIGHSNASAGYKPGVNLIDALTNPLCFEQGGSREALCIASSADANIPGFLYPKYGISNETTTEMWLTYRDSSNAMGLFAGSGLDQQLFTGNSGGTRTITIGNKTVAQVAAKSSTMNATYGQFSPTGLSVTGAVTSTLGTAVITSVTPGTGVTSVTCATATCTVSRGTYTVVGGTATTGTFATLVWPTTTTAWACSAVMNGGTGFLGIGHSVATATGMTLSAGVTIVGTTFNVDYQCQP